MDELCKDVVGFEGLYSVNTNGIVKRISSQRALSPAKRNGYKIITISGRKVLKKTLKIHRIVAEAFIPNPENKPYVNHKDGNKLNNSLHNLEWVTAKENMQHAYKTGLSKTVQQYIKDKKDKLILM